MEAEHRSQCSPKKGECNKGLWSDLNGPCTQEELVMMCTKWHCTVDMRIDNFLFWLMKQTKEKRHNGNDESFRRKIPRYFDALRTSGLRKYQAYQEAYAEKNRQYQLRCAEWRNLELRRYRFFYNLRSNWASSSSDSDEEEDSDDSEIELQNASRNEVVSIKGNFTFGSNSSIATVIDASERRYNSYPETESLDIQPINIFDNVGNEEEVNYYEKIDDVDSLDDINTQSFIPTVSSTQKN